MDIKQIQALEPGCSNLKFSGHVKYTKEPKHFAGTSKKTGQPYSFDEQFIIVQDDAGSSIGVVARVQPTRPFCQGEYVNVSGGELQVYNNRQQIKGTVSRVEQGGEGAGEPGYSEPVEPQAPAAPRPQAPVRPQAPAPVCQAPRQGDLDMIVGNINRSAAEVVSCMVGHLDITDENLRLGELRQAIMEVTDAFARATLMTRATLSQSDKALYVTPTRPAAPAAPPTPVAPVVPVAPQGPVTGEELEPGGIPF